MLAEVTYNAGLSYQIGSHKFFLNRGVLVRDSRVIRRAQNTKGFTVNVIKKAKPKKKGKKTIAVEKTASGKTKRALDSEKPKKKKPAK